jgi:hypothetical protein
MTKYYHAEVLPPNGNVYKSDEYAFTLAEKYASKVVAAGGKLAVGRSFGEKASELFITLDGASEDAPGDLIPELTWHEIHVSIVPAAEDQGITE